MWTGCSGSLIPNLFVEDSAGEDAATGTVAHGIAEQWLRTGIKPVELIGTTTIIDEGDEQFEIDIDEEMFDYIQDYVDYVSFLPGIHYVETRVDFSDLTPIPNQRGTADHAAISGTELTVTDLKFGKGIMVYADSNTQAILYAYGFFKQYDELIGFTKIRIRIAQPRLNHFDEWELTRNELLEWADWIKERAFAAWCPGAERKPAVKTCQWCKIKPDCGAYTVFSERLLDDVFLDETAITKDDLIELDKRLSDPSYELWPRPIGTLTIEQKARLLQYEGMIISWFNQIREDLVRRANDGAAIPGYKLVESRSRRKFSSAKAFLELLARLRIPQTEGYMPQKILSPAMAEALLIKYGRKRNQLPELLDPVVVKPPGKPTLVVESDKRPALVSIIDSTFKDESDEL